jgi:L-fuculose-phosphate aldolase
MMENDKNCIDKKRSDLLTVIRELDSKGFLCGSSGNVSIKIDDNKYLITPSGIPVFMLKAEDILLIDSSGNITEYRSDGLKPSSEVFMHLFCYKKKADIMSVIHSHAPASSAFAISGKSLDLCVMPEIVMVFGEIPLVPYTTPATKGLAEAVSGYIQKDYRAVLLENHGVLVTGKDVFDACNNLTIVETYAKTLINALALGNINALSHNQVAALNELKKGLNFETTGITCGLNDLEQHGIEINEISKNSPELADLIAGIVFKKITENK